MNNLDLLSVGDASIDVFVTPIDTETQCKLDSKECLICFPYGDKIPVTNFEMTVGGNAANNAVGGRRFGLKTGIILTTGDDSAGVQIVDGLSKEEVDCTYVFQQKDSRSNYSTVISYSGERTIFVYHAPRVYEFPKELPTVPWTYLTSMGESFQPFYESFVEWKKAHTEVKLAFNPGSWQFRVGVSSIRDVMALTDIIFVNREEAEKLTGFKAESGMEKELLTKLCALGPKTSVITDGGAGAFSYDGSKFLKIGVLPVDAYERTGAGDAFGSGFLSATIKGKSLEDALVWGTVNSASVIGYTGPQRGLLKESQIEEWVNRSVSSGVKVEAL